MNTVVPANVNNNKIMPMSKSIVYLKTSNIINIINIKTVENAFAASKRSNDVGPLTNLTIKTSSVNSKMYIGIDAAFVKEVN